MVVVVVVAAKGWHEGGTIMHWWRDSVTMETRSVSAKRGWSVGGEKKVGNKDTQRGREGT